MIYSENRVSSILCVVYYKLKNLNNQDKIMNLLDNSLDFMYIQLNNVDKKIFLSTKLRTFAN